MTDEDVTRYIDLCFRRIDITSKCGIDWKPEYTEELERIDREIAEIRPMIVRELERRK